MRKLITIFVLIQVLSTHAQKESNIWYFGLNAGVDFNSGTPVALTNGQLSTLEGCSTICNSDGALLFYTDGKTVFNRQHQVMQNGTDLLGDDSSSQSALIVKVPGSSQQYYIFTVGAFAIGGFNYSIVDMTADNGLGVVIQKNINLLSTSSEGITGTLHSNGEDIWIVVHSFPGNIMYSYRVTSEGVEPPVVNSVGPQLQEWWNDIEPVSSVQIHGCMKLSSNGSKLAMANFGRGATLFDFNTTTGVVSNPVELYTADITEYDGAFGVEFSLSGNVLYLNVMDRILQYNILEEDIAASATTVLDDENGSWSALQLAPDGKIYKVNVNSSFLGVVNNPEVIGTGCDVQNEAVYLGEFRYGQVGLPTALASLFIAPVIIGETVCLSDNVDFSIDWNRIPDAVSWDFGDNMSVTGITASHTYSAAGTYTVTATILNSGNTYLAQREITVYAEPQFSMIEGCEGSYYKIAIEGTQPPGSLITWQGPDGFESEEAIITPPIKGVYTVTVTSPNGCATQRSVTVNSVGCVIPKGISPNGDSKNDNFDLIAYAVKKLVIFNRYGQEVYVLNNYTDQFKGDTIGGQQLPDGTYYYLAQLDENINKTGWIYINRLTN